jgi:hypothetical protein
MRGAGNPNHLENALPQVSMRVMDRVKCDATGFYEVSKESLIINSLKV